jgi:uncharacterized Zn-binding protein involved in type VI secretion
MLKAVLVLAAAFSLGSAQAALAETPTEPAAPGVIVGGSGDVSVGDLPAARQGDITDGGDVLTEGSANVFINGRPAVTMGDSTGCGGVAVGGDATVFVNGKPLARAGDLTTACDEK